MPDDGVGLVQNNNPVPDLHTHRFPAVEAGSVDTYCFSGNQPADRQRLKSSLSEPLRPAVNADSELSRLIVERRKRGDEIGARVKPARNTGVEQSVNDLSALFRSN